MAFWENEYSGSHTQGVSCGYTENRKKVEKVKSVCACEAPAPQEKAKRFACEGMGNTGKSGKGGKSRYGFRYVSLFEKNPGAETTICLVQSMNGINHIRNTGIMSSIPSILYIYKYTLEGSRIQ